MHENLDYELLKKAWQTDATEERAAARERLLDFFCEKDKKIQNEISKLKLIKENLVSYLKEKELNEEGRERLKKGMSFISWIQEGAQAEYMFDNYVMQWFQWAWEAQADNDGEDSDEDTGWVTPAIDYLKLILTGQEDAYDDLLQYEV